MTPRSSSSGRDIYAFNDGVLATLSPARNVFFVYFDNFLHVGEAALAADLWANSRNGPIRKHMLWAIRSESGSMGQLRNILYLNRVIGGFRSQKWKQVVLRIWFLNCIPQLCHGNARGFATGKTISKRKKDVWKIVLVGKRYCCELSLPLSCRLFG